MAEFMEFAPEEFPVTVEAYNATGEVVWSVTADGPGGLTVPELRSQHGPIGVRLYTNGTLHSDNPPPGPEELREMQRRHGLDWLGPGDEPRTS